SDPYGVKALFAIYLAQIDNTKVKSDTIHVDDLISGPKQDRNF
ncbi:unnamed protein product, partial [Rotaria sp. Silwood1]